MKKKKEEDAKGQVSNWNVINVLDNFIKLYLRAHTFFSIFAYGTRNEGSWDVYY